MQRLYDHLAGQVLAAATLRALREILASETPARQL